MKQNSGVFGLWTRRREFESPPGYHIPEFHILILSFFCILNRIPHLVQSQGFLILPENSEPLAERVAHPEVHGVIVHSDERGESGVTPSASGARSATPNRRPKGHGVDREVSVYGYVQRAMRSRASDLGGF